MRHAALRGIGMAVVLLVGVIGGHGVRAQTAGESAPLYENSTGVSVGSVSITVSGTTMPTTITLQGLRSNATYTICVTDPLSQQQMGACTSANTGLGAAVLATIPTDATGGVTGTFTIPEVLPVAIVAISNNANPSDSAQAVVNTGATSSGICQSFFVPQPAGAISLC